MPAVRPSSADPLVALADRCVQCGLCLPACPTYRHDALEAESPRGRIALVRGWALGIVEPTPTGDRHLDQCLGCRSCEAVCPAGVKYGDVLAGARARQRQRRGPGWSHRVVEWLAARPTLLERLLRVYGRLYPALPAAWRRLPRPPAPTSLPGRNPVPTSGPGPEACTGRTPPAAAELRERSGTRDRASGQWQTGQEAVAVFTGCAARAYEPPVQAALAALCAATGARIEAPPGQTCCGALHMHAGNPAQAERLAARNRSAFAKAGTVLSLASGCHEAISRSLDPGTAAVDAIAFLDSRREQLRFGPLRERVALHLPCTQRHLVRSVPALRRLLAQVPDLEVIELDAGFGCCGAAGTQMLTDPARAADFRRPLLERFAASGATRLLSANIGCRLHLAGGTAACVQHPLELLAEALLAPVPLAHAPAVDCTA